MLRTAATLLEPSAPAISHPCAAAARCSRWRRALPRRPALDMNGTGAMSWTKDDQTKLDLLRAKELAGTLTEPEHAELAALMARVEAEEVAALAPEMARLRAEAGAMANELGRIEGENEELARLMAQQQILIADARRFLDEFDRRRASILDGLARVAGGPLPAA
jgi:hypothetical protein